MTGARALALSGDDVLLLSAAAGAREAVEPVRGRVRAHD